MKYDLDDKKELSMNPFIVLINLLITGVIILMVYLAYRHMTADEEPLPPPRVVPAVVEIKDDVGDDALGVPHDEDDYTEDETPAETEPPVITRAITPPPTTTSPS